MAVVTIQVAGFSLNVASLDFTFFQAWFFNIQLALSIVQGIALSLTCHEPYKIYRVRLYPRITPR